MEGFEELPSSAVARAPGEDSSSWADFRSLGSRSPSIASSRTPSIISGRASSVFGSRAPSVASSRASSLASGRAPSVASSRAPSMASKGLGGSNHGSHGAASHRSPSVSSSRPPSISGSRAPSASSHSSFGHRSPGMDNYRSPSALGRGPSSIPNYRPPPSNRAPSVSNYGSPSVTSFRSQGTPSPRGIGTAYGEDVETPYQGGEDLTYPGNAEAYYLQERKAEYGLALQRACSSALLRVKSNKLIADSAWAAPLAAAPSAISTMAILLKAADNVVAAGLEIESQDVLENGKPVGRLPSKYFHTNLQHCSDVGRLAFLDAQNSMSVIRSAAVDVISPDGGIMYIIELLETPEEARYNLKPEIDAIRRTAQRCLDSAKQITDKFRYWYLVIMHLKNTSLSKQGDVVKRRQTTSIRQQLERQKEREYSQKKTVLNQRVQKLVQQVEAAQRKVEKAEKEVHRLKTAQIEHQGSILDDIQAVKGAIPDTEAPKIKRGGIVEFTENLLGQLPRHKAQDAANRREHDGQLEHRRHDVLGQLRGEREQKLARATSELNAAKAEEIRLTEVLEREYRELRNNTDQLAEATANLERAKGEFERLRRKDLELKGILTILENSTKDLGTLKDKVERLVEFFQEMLREIQDNVDGSLGDFLRPIENGIAMGSTPGEVEALRLGRIGKQRMMAAAFQMQGRFSVVADISEAYITISADYIRPAIMEMENLSSLNESEWAVQSRHFLSKCMAWTQGIEEVTRRASEEVALNAQSRINTVQHRAIQAAEDQAVYTAPRSVRSGYGTAY